MKRSLKIQSHYRESKTTLALKPPAKIVPSLTLSGEWFREAGFDPHAKVNITKLANGKLLIERN